MICIYDIIHFQMLKNINSVMLPGDQKKQWPIFISQITDVWHFLKCMSLTHDNELESAGCCEIILDN